MIKTQIQLPEALYREVKEVAREREMSLAELVRRGLEYVVRVYPRLRKPREEWKLPGPFNLGIREEFFDNPDWREEENLTSGTLSLIRERQSPKYGRKKRP